MIRRMDEGDFPMSLAASLTVKKLVMGEIGEVTVRQYPR